MPTPVIPVITNVGLAAAVDAEALGLKLSITHIALGAGSYTPLSTRTALNDIREVALVASGGTLDNQVTLSAAFLAADYTGPAYNVGEVGFYAGDPMAGGVLFAVSSEPGRSSPPRGGTNITNYGVTYIIALSAVPSGSVNVLVDPDASLALAALSQHVSATNPHPRYVRKTGDTMTGPLGLPGNAVNVLHAVPKQQLDAAIATHAAAADPHAIYLRSADFTSSNQSLTANGFQKLPGGLILQWGVYTADLDVNNGTPTPPTSVTFPIPFPTACRSVQLTSRNPTNDPLADSWPELVSRSTTGFSVVPQNSGAIGSTLVLHGFDWFAVGH